MNSIFIDLHGFTETEVHLHLDAFLLDFENGDYESGEIITGNGIVIKDVVIEELNNRNINWNFDNNNDGCIIISN